VSPDPSHGARNFTNEITDSAEAADAWTYSSAIDGNKLKAEYDQDLVNLRIRFAHSMKSSSTMLGMKDVSERVSTEELQARRSLLLHTCM